MQHGDFGQFQVFADGELIAERSNRWLPRLFGGGWPDEDTVVRSLEARKASPNRSPA